MRDRLIFTGQLISLMGSWMQNTAQPWLVSGLTHSTVLLGVTSFCSTVPVFLMTPFGGMVADRVDRRKFLLVTHFGEACDSRRVTPRSAGSGAPRGDTASR